jgi:hypothetical protein
MLGPDRLPVGGHGPFEPVQGFAATALWANGSVLLVGADCSFTTNLCMAMRLGAVRITGAVRALQYTTEIIDRRADTKSADHHIGRAAVPEASRRVPA